MMRKKERFRFVIFVTTCLAAAVALSLYALRQNISYFRSPTEIAQMKEAGAGVVAPGHVFRLGGLVKEGSLQKRDDSLEINFIVTDTVTDQKVKYSGILPDLFREGQGVVAKGSLDADGVFIATELLAKHDENYMPPEVAKSLEKAHAEGLEKMRGSDGR